MPVPNEVLSQQNEKKNNIARIASVALVAGALLSCGSLAALTNNSLGVGNHEIRSRYLSIPNEYSYDIEIARKTYEEACGASLKGNRLYDEDVARLGLYVYYSTFPKPGYYLVTHGFWFDGNPNYSGYEKC